MRRIALLIALLFVAPIFSISPAAAHGGHAHRGGRRHVQHYSGHPGGHYGGHGNHHAAGYQPHYHPAHYGHRYGHHYYPYSYPYGYGFGLGYPRYYYDGYPRYRHHRDGDHSSDADSDSNRGGPWQLFAKGRIGDAQKVFTRAEVDDPKDAVAKVGLALTAAESGDLKRGIWAMRRALRVDPQGVRYVPVDRRVGERIHSLIATYRRHADDEYKRLDYAFMLSALYYLVNENQNALEQVQLAIGYGDTSDSTDNLDKLLRG